MKNKHKSLLAASLLTLGVFSISKIINNASDKYLDPIIDFQRAELDSQRVGEYYIQGKISEAHKEVMPCGRKTYSLYITPYEIGGKSNNIPYFFKRKLSSQPRKTFVLEDLSSENIFHSGDEVKLTIKDVDLHTFNCRFNNMPVNLIDVNNLLTEIYFKESKTHQGADFYRQKHQVILEKVN